jgi:hypothetical protein
MAHDDQCGPEGEHSTTGVTGESDGNRTDQPGDGDSLTDAEEGEKSLLTRRDALKMGATAAAIATGAAVTSGPAAAAERYGIEFSRVVDAVEDLGMDPSGNEPIDDALQATIEEEGVLVEFPPGEYYVREEHSEGSLSNWGMRGLGDDPTDVRLVTDQGNSLRVLNVGGGSGLLFENVAFDYGDDWEGSMGINLKVSDDLRVQDVHFVGHNPTRNNGAVDNLNPQVLDPDGRAVVDGLVRTGPTEITSHGHLGDDSNEGVMWLGPKHEGELVVRNTHIANTGTNAIYCRSPPGDIKVENCLFRNNNQTAFRIGGDGCYIRDTEFVVDTDNAHPDNRGEFINPHCIIYETGDRGESGGYIENCEFVYRSAPSRTAAAFWADGSASDFEIRNCRFQLDADDVSAVRVDDPTEPRLGTTADRPWGVTLDGVSITGSASLSDPAVQLYNRDASVIRNSCLQLTGNADGILLEDSDDSVVEDTNVNVTGQATILNSANVETSNITDADSCPGPELDWDGSGSTDSTDSTDGGGDSTSSSSTTLPNELTVTGTGTKTNYEFAVTGALERGDDLESWDETSETTANGWVTSDGATDTFAFDGGLGTVSFLEGSADVSVNGHDVDPATLSSDAAYPRTLQVVPDGSSCNYSLEVSGEIADNPALGTSLSKYDTIDGGTLEGWVTNDMDAVMFSGDVTDFSFLEGGTTVYLDGEPVDPSTLGSDGDSTDDGSTTDGSTDDGSTDDGSTDDGSTDDGSTDDGSTDDGSTDDTELPHTVTVDGRDTEGLTGYEVTVSGDLARDTTTDGTDETTKWDSIGDDVSGGTVVGVVDEGIDQFRFSGEVVSMDVDGKASLSFDTDDT